MKPFQFCLPKLQIFPSLVEAWSNNLYTVITMIKRFLPLYRLQYQSLAEFASLKTHYELLDVDEGASFKEIKEKYLAKSKMYHPDVSSDT
jgi:DnaJ-domain-containing protein 1